MARQAATARLTKEVTVGHIRRHPKARHRWQVRYIDPAGQERARNFSRKADAEAFLHAIETDKLRGSYIDPESGRITFAEWAAQVEAARLDVSPSTHARDDSLLRNHVLPTFGPFQLRAIEPTHLRQWVARLQAQGLAPSTVAKCFQIVARILEAAVTDGLLPHSPRRRVSLPKVATEERRFLSAEEVAELAHVIDSRYRALVLFGAYTGTRLGEMAGLLTRDLDLLRGVAHIQGTKSRTSRRTVALSAFLREELAHHLAVHGPGRDGHVFPSPEGGPLHPTNFRRRIWKPAVAASVGEPMRPHDLRHTHVALLIAAGEDPYVISQRLGHASIKTTYDIYGHLFEGRDQEAADRLDEVARRAQTDTRRTPDGHRVIPLNP